MAKERVLKNVLIASIILVLTLTCYSQDSMYVIRTPVNLRLAYLYSNKSCGATFGTGHLHSRKQITKRKKSGYIKEIFKDRYNFYTLGFYYQPGLHSNWNVVWNYLLRRTNKQGFYSEFSPQIGISRTFINSTTYDVNESGKVSIKKFAGNWYLLSGFNYGVGKIFAHTERKLFFNEIYLKAHFQILYPNFKFINLKPFLILGTSFNLYKLQFKSKVIINRTKR